MRIRISLAWAVLIFGLAVWASTVMIAVSDSQAEVKVESTD